MAAGPELLFGGLASSSVTNTAASGAAATGPFFSVATRAGVVLGKKTPTRRSGFMLGLDMHVVFNPGDPVLTPCLALGYESF